MHPKRLIWILIAFLFVLAACAPAAAPTALPAADRQRTEGTPPATANPTPDVLAEEETYRIVTLLPRDAIPAIDDPIFISAQEAAGEYRPEELVIGVSFEGDSRAYSVELLSSHEIVNDTVGGRKIAVTW